LGSSFRISPSHAWEHTSLYIVHIQSAPNWAHTLSHPMAVGTTMVKRNVQKCSSGFAAQISLVSIAVFFTNFFVLRLVWTYPSSMAGGTQVQVEFLLVLWFVVFAHFLDASRSRATEPTTDTKKRVAKKRVIDKLAPDGRRQVGSAVPTADGAPLVKQHLCHGSSTDTADPSGQEARRQRSDLHITSCTLAVGVPCKTSRVLEVMHSCIRLAHGEAAVKLFDQMLQTGPPPNAHLIGKAVSHRFFTLVGETLDHKRIQEDGVRLLELIRAHGIAPSPATQNRLLEAWRNQLPEVVLEYFIEMKGAGISLSRWAYRYIVVAHERSDPAFALKIYSEMEVLGIQLDRAAYNAVLGARFQLGMLDEAEELFQQMVYSSLVPNEKTYGIMIKARAASNHHEEAIALFEKMQEQGFEPDRYAYHHAIRSGIILQRVEYAVDLYNGMVQKKVPPLTNTVSLLSGACHSAGWHALAAELATHLAHAKAAETAHGARALARDPAKSAGYIPRAPQRRCVA